MNYLLDHAELDWDDTTPFSTHYDDIYWHRGVPLQEKTNVFIHPFKRKSEAVGPNQQFTIIELGFGFGINTLLAADAWQEKPRDCQLNIVSIEKHPVDHNSLQQFLEPLPLKFKSTLSSGYPPPYMGQHIIWLAPNIRLLLIFDEVETALADLDAEADLWFLDGFAPSKNPEMWQPGVCRKMFARSKPGAELVTYSSASRVRNALSENGFMTEKIPGYGRKKEMLTAHRSGDWQVSAHRLRKTTVIGAGMAGAFIFEAVNRRCQQITLIHDDITGPSWIPQLSVLPQLAIKPEARYRFSLLAHQYMQDCPGFHRSGLIWHGRTPDETLRLQITSAQFPDELMRATDTGADFPQAGWFSLHKFLQEVEVETRLAHVSKTTYDGSVWHCDSEDGESFTSEQVILTTGGNRTLLPSELQVRAVRGQAISVDAAVTGPVINGNATVFPSVDGRSLISGTYDRSTDTAARESDSKDLLERANEYVELSPDDVQPMVGIRAVSRDRLPVVGAEPDWEKPSTRNPKDNGRYFCTAFGSRGANHARLCAEHLISKLMGEPTALSISQQRMLAPGRFHLRDLNSPRQTNGR